MMPEQTGGRMGAISNDEISHQLRWRYATKSFDPAKRIAPADLEVLKRSLELSPSSFGLQPWAFFFVDTPKVREDLRAVSWNQQQVTNASHFVVLAARSTVDEAFVQRYVERICAVRGQAPAAVEPYRQMMLGFIANPALNVDEWVSRQVYIALGFLLSTAAMMSIDACPMEGIDAGKYDEILGLRDRGFETRVACALGYRAADDYLAPLPKVRYEREELIAHF